MRKLIFSMTAILLVFMTNTAFIWSPKAIIATQSYKINLDFDLVNKTGYTIKDIFVSPTSEQDWGEDIMGRQLLKDGETVAISFDRNETAKKWDIYVTWDGYDSEEDVYWIGFDLSAIEEITLYYDEKSGKTWAETK